MYLMVGYPLTPYLEQRSLEPSLMLTAPPTTPRTSAPNTVLRDTQPSSTSPAPPTLWATSTKAADRTQTSRHSPTKTWDHLAPQPSSTSATTNRRLKSKSSRPSQSTSSRPPLPSEPRPAKMPRPPSRMKYPSCKHDTNP